MKNAAHLAKIFKALSDENRVRILLHIYKNLRECCTEEMECTEENCIKKLASFLQITVPTVSHHVKELVNAGLIKTQKKGRWVYCQIDKKSFAQVEQFLNSFKE